MQVVTKPLGPATHTTHFQRSNHLATSADTGGQVVRALEMCSVSCRAACLAKCSKAIMGELQYAKTSQSYICNIFDLSLGSRENLYQTPCSWACSTSDIINLLIN